MPVCPAPKIKNSVAIFHPCKNKGLQTTKIEVKSKGENQPKWERMRIVMLNPMGGTGKKTLGYALTENIQWHINSVEALHRALTLLRSQYDQILKAKP
jgi:hypothetical protein